MSLGPLNTVPSAVRKASGQPAAGKPRTLEDASGFIARLTLASENGQKLPDNLQAAQAAEITRLQMMNRALSGGSDQTISSGSPGFLPLFRSGDNTVEESADPVNEGATGSAVTGAELPPAAIRSSAEPVGDRFSNLIRRASKRYGVEEHLIKAVIHAESDFCPTAVSRAGAQGLMQLMPATSSGMGVTNPFDPEQNIMAGTRFLKNMLSRYGGDVDKALAAYNWGPGNLDRKRGELPRETREYIARVRHLSSDYQSASG